MLHAQHQQSLHQCLAYPIFCDPKCCRFPKKIFKPSLNAVSVRRVLSKLISKFMLYCSCCSVGSVVEWLERRARDQHGLGSKPTRAILLYPWERHFTAHSPAWWSWQAVLNYSHISIKLQATAISWHLRKQVGVFAYPMY